MMGKKTSEIMSHRNRTSNRNHLDSFLRKTQEGNLRKKGYKRQ